MAPDTPRDRVQTLDLEEIKARLAEFYVNNIEARIWRDMRVLIAEVERLAALITEQEPPTPDLTKEPAMKLYRILFDDQPDYVEAPTFGEAIGLWRLKLIADNAPGDFEADVEPESVELVHDQPVLRDAAASRAVPEGEP